MDESVEFYTEILSLEIDNRFKPNDDIEITFLCKGDTKFELVHNRSLNDINYSGCGSTGFSVDSVDEYIDYLKTRDVLVLEGPFQPSPHIRFFYINDPNGYKIQLVEQS